MSTSLFATIFSFIDCLLPKTLITGIGIGEAREVSKREEASTWPLGTEFAMSPKSILGHIRGKIEKLYSSRVEVGTSDSKCNECYLKS
jgi:hypothetical protein